MFVINLLLVLKFYDYKSVCLNLYLTLKWDDLVVKLKLHGRTYLHGGPI